MASPSTFVPVRSSDSRDCRDPAARSCCPRSSAPSPSLVARCASTVRQCVIATARQGVRRGLALVTEDRKGTGLVLSQSILDNALLAIRAVFPSRTSGMRAKIPGILESLEVISRGADQEVRALSGGNQQKVVLAKWLATSPRVVLLDEPTRGIDVGAKVAVYRLIRSLARRGVAILLVSSELPEVLGMSDRVLVMADGRIAGELPPEFDRGRGAGPGHGNRGPGGQ